MLIIKRQVSLANNKELVTQKNMRCRCNIEDSKEEDVRALSYQGWQKKDQNNSSEQWQKKISLCKTGSKKNKIK